MPYRTTITINDIVEQHKYYNARITVFTFGKLGEDIINQLENYLIAMVEEEIGYGMDDWWDIEGETFVFNYEKNTNCDYSDATGLGFYYAEMVYENSNGKTITMHKINIHNKKFGEFVY